MSLNLKVTVERSKRRSYFLSPVFITKCFSKKFVLVENKALEKVAAIRRVSRGSGMGEFSPPPPPFLSPLFLFFSYPSNTSTRLWFYYIITKI